PARARAAGFRLRALGGPAARRARRAREGVAGRARAAGVPAQRVHRVPHHHRRVGRDGRPQPESRRRPRDDRRRAVPEYRRVIAPLDYERAVAEAGRADAAAEPLGPRSRRRDRLSPEPEMKSWLTTTDHKRIGLLYFWTAFGFFLIGGLEALLIRWQLARPEGMGISAETYNQLFTMHGTTMVFLALMPLSAAFFNFIIPLQIGARDVAFPRLNAFSYWVFLLGGLLLNASFIAGPLFGADRLSVAPDAGWFAYANLTSRQFSAGPNVDFWLLGLQILGIASLAAGFNFIVTILNMRAPGMRMLRLPPFTWMTLITQFLVITAFPVITV